MYWHESQAQSKMSSSITPEKPSPWPVFLTSWVSALMVSLRQTRQNLRKPTCRRIRQKKVSLPELQITRESHTCGQGKQNYNTELPHRWQAKISSLFNCPELHTVPVLCSISPLPALLFALHFVSPANLSLGEQPSSHHRAPLIPGARANENPLAATPGQLCSASTDSTPWQHLRTAPGPTGHSVCKND